MRQRLLGYILPGPAALRGTGRSAKDSGQTALVEARQQHAPAALRPFWSSDPVFQQEPPSYTRYAFASTFTTEIRHSASSTRPSSVRTKPLPRNEVETAAVWLWSLKDYLKKRLDHTGGNPNDVEAYVNGSRYLPVLADIANGAKHAELTKSRSGRFARLGGCSMAVRTGMRLEQVQDEDADVQVTLDDPNGVSYKLSIVDRNGKYVGNGLVLLRPRSLGGVAAIHSEICGPQGGAVMWHAVRSLVRPNKGLQQTAGGRERFRYPLLAEPRGC